MFSNSTLYYLSQMGISPLVKLKTSSYSSKLIVLLPQKPIDKAEILFQHMMTYLNTKRDKIVIMPVNKILNEKIANPPLGILVFGCEEAKLQDTGFYPVVRSLDLDYLLEYPLLKKKVFQDLNSLKRLL